MDAIVTVEAARLNVNVPAKILADTVAKQADLNRFQEILLMPLQRELDYYDTDLDTVLESEQANLAMNIVDLIQWLDNFQ